MAGNTIEVFDLKILATAVDETSSEASDSTDLGAISTYYDDLLNNEGNSLLPYG